MDDDFDFLDDVPIDKKCKKRRKEEKRDDIRACKKCKKRRKEEKRDDIRAWLLEDICSDEETPKVHRKVKGLIEKDEKNEKPKRKAKKSIKKDTKGPTKEMKEKPRKKWKFKKEGNGPNAAVGKNATKVPNKMKISGNNRGMKNFRKMCRSQIIKSSGKKSQSAKQTSSSDFVGKDWRESHDWSWSLDPYGIVKKVEVGVVNLDYPVSSIPESIFVYVDPCHEECSKKTPVSFIFDKFLDDSMIGQTPQRSKRKLSEINHTVGRESFRYRLQEVIDRKNRLDFSDFEESDWCKFSRTMSLPGAKRDGQYVYPPEFTDEVSGKTVYLQQSAMAEFKESTSWVCARDIEYRVFSEIYEIFRVKMFSKFLVRVDRTQAIDDQIAKCSMKIRTDAAQLDHELKVEFEHLLGLDKEHYRMYKHTMRDITKSLNDLVDQMANPHVFVDGVSKEGPSNFSQLTFLEKTVYTWHSFVEEFERLRDVDTRRRIEAWSWEFLYDQELESEFQSMHCVCFNVSNFTEFETWSWEFLYEMQLETDSPQSLCFNKRNLTSFVRVPELSHVMTEAEKHEARSKFFHLLEEPFSMRLKEMIGLFCACVKHYSQEESWKKLFVRRILQKEIPELYSFWYTCASGPWSETDMLELIYSLDFKFNSKIKDSLRVFVRTHSHELKIEKKKALNELFSHLLHDKLLLEKNPYQMKLKVVKEPGGRIVLKSSTGIDCSKCGGDTCKWGSGFQSRSGDEPMDEFLLCKSCGFFEKI